MFVRHLKKFNNAEEMQAAIAAGTLASPYVALDSSSNVVNLVLPAESEPSTIDYSQESDNKVRLTDRITVDEYLVEGSFLDARLDISIIFDEMPGCVPQVRVCDRSWYELEVSQQGLTEEEFMLACFNPNGIDTLGGHERYDYTSWNYLSAVPASFEYNNSIHWKSGTGYNNSGVNPLRTSANNLPVPSEDVSLVLGGNDRQGYYVVLAAYIDEMTGVPVKAYKLDNYRMDVYLTNDSSLVNSTMPNTKYAYEYRYSGGELTTELDYTFYILQNSVYDKARLVMYWAEDYSTPEEAMTGSSDYLREYDVANFTQSGAFRNFGFSSKLDAEGWPLNNSGDTDLHARFALQLYNSTTSVESPIYGYEGPAVEGQEEPPQPENPWFSMLINNNYFTPDSSYAVYHFTIECAGNPGSEGLTWPYVTYGAYEVTEYAPAGDASTMESVLGSNYDDFPVGTQYYDIEIPVDMQPGESRTYCVCAAPMNDAPATELAYAAYQTITISVPSESSTDVSTGYIFSVGANNGGYFNTGYVPGADTVVQLKGKIINDGASAHGIKGNYSDWMYRIFGNEGDVYFDRMDDQVRITAAVNDIENTSHEYEFGNYYIKVDGVTEATDSESDLSNFYTEIPLFVFATSQMGAMGEGILDTLAAEGTELEYFKILEPDGNGGLNLEKDLRPALDASGNVCLYDQVAGDIIYPEGSSVNIVATAISGDEPGPDSSTSSTDIIALHGNPGPTPSTENPFVTLMVDASIDALSSWDHMEVGIYSLNHYENNGYSSINAYRLGGFIKTCTIALTNGTAHYSIQSADDLDCSEIPAGDGYTFTGYDDTICVVAWFIREYGAGYTDDEIFELYEYELPSSSGGDSSILTPANPAVEYANYLDDGAGTITFDAWLNDDAIAAGVDHYSVGLTSDATMHAEQDDAMNPMNNLPPFDLDAWMVARCGGTYSGDSMNPDTITLYYNTGVDDQGSVIAVMYDYGDNIIQYNGSDYQTIDGWSYSIPPVEEPVPEPEPEPEP